MTKSRIALLVLALVIATIGGAYVRLHSYFAPNLESIKGTVRHDERTGKINICIIGKDDTENSQRPDTILFTVLDI
ncbi:MAG: LytR family transcriptional regulator, partial [Acetomicrobium sp.]